jgi:hypothetical protein
MVCKHVVRISLRSVKAQATGVRCEAHLIILKCASFSSAMKAHRIEKVL